MEPYIEIDLNKLNNNLNNINKKCQEYEYIYLDISYFNDISKELIEVILNNNINRVVVKSFKTALNIRKYNSKIEIIVKDILDMDSIYDAINNNISITVYKKDYLERLSTLKIKDKLNIYYVIDNYYEKFNYKKIMDIISNNKYLNIEGFYTYLNDKIDNEYYCCLNNFLKLVKGTNNLKVFTNNLLLHKKHSNMNGIMLDIELLGFNKITSNKLLEKIKVKKLLKENDDIISNIDLEKVISIKTSIINKLSINKDKYLYVINGGINNSLNKNEYYINIKNDKYNIEELYYNYLVIYTKSNIKSDSVVNIDFSGNIDYIFIKNLLNNFHIEYINFKLKSIDYL